MKQQASVSDAPPRRIVAEMMGKMTDEALTNLPQRDALRRTIQRKRKTDNTRNSVTRCSVTGGSVTLAVVTPSR